jgi:mono/diheme cytochrome c family protein
MVNGALVETFPFEITAEILAEGRRTYNDFCAPCHGLAGYGDGIIAREGFPPPVSFHSDSMRAKPVGHYFEVITNGQGAMFNYAARIQPADRWAVVAYVRALQYSQFVPLDSLSPEQQAQVAEVDQ